MCTFDQAPGPRQGHPTQTKLPFSSETDGDPAPMLRRGVHDAIRLASKSAANLQRCGTARNQGVIAGVLNASRRAPMLQIPPQTLPAFSPKGMSPVRGHGIVAHQQIQACIRGSELRGSSVASPSLPTGPVIQLVAGKHATRGGSAGHAIQAQTPACIRLIQSRSMGVPAAVKTMGVHGRSPASLSGAGGKPTMGIGRVIQRAALGVQGGVGARSHWGRANRFDDYRSWTIVRRIERYTGREFEPDYVIYIIIGVNLVVFLLWQNHRFQRFMYENFTLSTRGIFKEGRIHTLFTYMWSHQSTGHLLGNMVTLWFFGTEAIALLGVPRFLAIYMAAGLASGVAQLIWPSIAAKLPIPAARRAWAFDRTLGASGAINAVVAFNILTFPTRTILLWFIIPVPSALLGALWLGKDVVSLYSGDSNVGNAGHIAGSVVGAAVWMYFRKQIRWH